MNDEGKDPKLRFTILIGLVLGGLISALGFHPLDIFLETPVWMWMVALTLSLWVVSLIVLWDMWRNLVRKGGIFE